MIYRKTVPKIINKLTDGDEDLDKTNKDYQEKVLSRGSIGERKITNKIARTQNRTFDINQKVLDKIERKRNINVS